MVLRRAEVGQNINLERELVRLPARKRTDTIEEDNTTIPTSSSKKYRTKRKYPLQVKTGQVKTGQIRQDRLSQDRSSQDRSSQDRSSQDR